MKLLLCFFSNIYVLNVFCIVFVDLLHICISKGFLMLSHGDICAESKIGTIKYSCYQSDFDP